MQTYTQYKTKKLKSTQTMLSKTIQSIKHKINTT